MTTLFTPPIWVARIVAMEVSIGQPSMGPACQGTTLPYNCSTWSIHGHHLLINVSYPVWNVSALHWHPQLFTLLFIMFAITHDVIFQREWFRTAERQRQIQGNEFWACHSTTKTPERPQVSCDSTLSSPSCFSSSLPHFRNSYLQFCQILRSDPKRWSLSFAVLLETILGLGTLQRCTFVWLTVGRCPSPGFVADCLKQRELLGDKNVQYL